MSGYRCCTKKAAPVVSIKNSGLKIETLRQYWSQEGRGCSAGGGGGLGGRGRGGWGCGGWGCVSQSGCQ